MPSCYVCRQAATSYDMRVGKVHFHTFPSSRRHPMLLQKWKSFARVPHGVDVTKLMLCSRHFTEDQLIRHPLRVKLKRDSVPALLPPATEGHVPDSQRESYRIALAKEEAEKGKDLPEPMYILIPPHETVNPRSFAVRENREYILPENPLLQEEEEEEEEAAVAGYDEELLESVRGQLCRVCGMKHEFLLPIYSMADAAEGDTLTLSKKIEMYLPLEIGVEEGLPSNICQECCNLLELWHELHTTCLAADSLLRSMFTPLKNDVAVQIPGEDDRSAEENGAENNHNDSIYSKREYPKANGDCMEEIDNNIKEVNECTESDCYLMIAPYENKERISERTIESIQEEALYETNSVEHDSSTRSEGEKLLPVFKCKFCGQELSYRVLGENGQECSGGNRNSRPLSCRYCNNYDHRENTNKLDSEVREFLKQVEGQMASGAISKEIIPEIQVEEIPEKWAEDITPGNQVEEITPGSQVEETTLESQVEEITPGNQVEEIIPEKLTGETVPANAERYHVSKHDGARKSYICTYCGHAFPTKEIELSHKKKCLLEPAVCEWCGRMFKTRKDLKSHAIKHTYVPSPAICEKCGKTFSSRSGLKVHMRDRHGDTKFICEPCCKVFTNASTHYVHRRRHEKEEVKSLNLKIGVSEESGKEGMFVCPVCEEIFHDKLSVIMHMNAPKKIKCTTCRAWVLSEKFTLTHKCHILSCRYCSKSFNKRSLKYVHERTHTGEKPFSCLDCGKLFSSASTLYSHRITHRPPGFKCEVCDKHFKRRSLFVDHLRSHAGVMHLCQYCDQTFSTRKAMYKHRMKKHRDKIVVVKHE